MAVGPSTAATKPQHSEQSGETGSNSGRWSPEKKPPKARVKPRATVARRSAAAIKFETRDTRQEDNLHDSVCDVMRFRIFTEIFV